MILISLLAFIPKAAEAFLNGLFLMIAWNAIAGHFNMPTFDYWVFVGVSWVVVDILETIRPKLEVNHDEKEKKK